MVSNSSELTRLLALTRNMRANRAADDGQSEDNDQNQTTLPVSGWCPPPPNSPREGQCSPAGLPIPRERRLQQAWEDDWPDRRSPWVRKKPVDNGDDDDRFERRSRQVGKKTIDSEKTIDGGTNKPTLPELPGLSDNRRLPLLVFNDGDTLVYIDPASRCAECENAAAFTASQPCIAPHRVRSQSLLKTGSEFFRKMFEPRYQTRVLRRRGLTGNLPKGIKYVLDLTPASEGDDAVIFMTEVSCPMGIRTWAQSRDRLNLPLSCVGGEDEVEGLPCNHAKEGSSGTSQTAPGEKEEKSNQPREAKGPNANLASKTPSRVPGLPLDYSPVRHRTGIERILHALEGLDPRLDTAPKFWTFFALAKLFDVAARPPICDYILSWLYEQSNALFIELHPEITYRVACGIQCSDLCRATFAILVGEEALLLLNNPGKLSALRRPTKTFHGRARETLDDTELQRIEYASKSFMERILGSFVDLAGVEMRWLTELSEFRKIANYTPQSAEEAFFISDLVRRLKVYIRVRICKTLCTWRQTYILPQYRDLGCGTGMDYSQDDFISAYAGMQFAERVMSRSFWTYLLQDLSSGDFHKDPGVLYFPESMHLPAFNGQDDAKVTAVGTAEMLRLAYAFNQMLGSEAAPSTSTPSSSTATPSPFTLSQFLTEAAQYVAAFSHKMLASPFSEKGAYDMQLELTDTLTCLSHDEFRFLPLWAGGDDDGSGGVFTDHNIPMVEAGGFSAPGPSVHTGSTVPSADSYSMVSASEAASTAQVASHRATGGYGTEVMSVSSLWEEVRTNKDQERNSEDAADVESLEKMLDAIDIGADDVASVSSGTVVIGSPDLLDPLNEDEELNLEEGEPVDDLSDHN